MKARHNDFINDIEIYGAMRPSGFIFMFLVALAYVISAAVYESLPESIATHWGGGGQPDGYSPKHVALSIIPATMAFYALLFSLIPRFVAKKEYLHLFALYFDRFLFTLLLFLLGIHIFIISWAMGYRMDVAMVISALMAPLYYSIGHMLENLDPAWSKRKKYAWPQFDDKTSKKVQEQIAQGFKLAGIAMLMGAFLPQYAMWVIIIANVAVCVWLFAVLAKEFLAARI
ncbi:MAG: DUF1648 domain-containing protein [Nitrospinota bacterium]|nr:DUF1648 domain-containing protein [Nitrospinota bacterium]